MELWPRHPGRLKVSLVGVWIGAGLLGLLASSWRTSFDRVALLLYLAAWGYAAVLLYRHLTNAPRVLAEVIRVPVDQILDNPFRIRVVPDPESVEGLARSIEAYGIIVPIQVRPRGDKYELISGQRRVLAAKRLGRAWVPALVRSLSDKEMLEVGLLDNVQRASLSQIEEARAFSRLSREFEALPERDLTASLGLDPVWVGVRERLLALPEVVQQAVILGTITSGHAQALVELTDPERQIEFLKKTCENRWDPQELARQIADHLAKNPAADAPQESAPPA